jgi:hypothetical protein
MQLQALFLQKNGFLFVQKKCRKPQEGAIDLTQDYNEWVKSQVFKSGYPDYVHGMVYKHEGTGFSHYRKDKCAQYSFLIERGYRMPNKGV